MDQPYAIHTLIAHVSELHHRIALLEGKSDAEADRTTVLIATLTVYQLMGKLDELLWDQELLTETLRNAAAVTDKYSNVVRRIVALASDPELIGLIP